MNDRAAYANANATRLPLADKSVHMIATSPPYWGLRSYATGANKAAELGAEKAHDCLAWARGDDPCGACYVCNMREWAREMWRVLRDDGVMFLNLGDSYASSTKSDNRTPDERSATSTLGPKRNGLGGGNSAHIAVSFGPQKKELSGLKPKDLCGIPWRVALALQADGWYLRSDCIWEKPNAMPSSVTDRPSTSHEYIFLLTKRPRYYWDNEAVKEPAVTTPGNGWAVSGLGKTYNDTHNHNGQGATTLASVRSDGTRNLRTVWTINTVPFSGAHFATWPPALVERMVKAGTSERGVCPTCGAPWRRVVDKGEAVNAPRNPNDALPYTANGSTNHGNGATTLHKVRQVETVEWRPTCTCNRDGLDLQPDDFEIIPTPTGSRAGTDPSLIVGRAGYSRPRGDNEGQRPITRYEQRHYARQIRQSADKAQMANEAGPAFSHYVRTDSSGARPIPQDLLDRWIATGWLGRVVVPEFRPHAPVPAIVLDPFCGSGTTLEVARRLGRIGLGFDLSETYLRDNAAVRLGHDKLAAWGRGIVDTGDYSDLFRVRPNGDGATE